MGNNIKFVIGEENRHVITTISKDTDYKESIFKSQFKAAFSCINTYLKNRRKDIPTNNIISFIGDRGSGKTSCMRSVAKMLCDENKNLSLDIIKKEDNIEIDQIKTQKFIGIDIIDPSFFDEKHNILEFLVAQLYKNFRDRCEGKNTPRISNTQQQELAQVFSKTQKDLKYMFSKTEDNYSSIEHLQHLAAAVDLNKDIETLITKYCEIMEKDANAIIIVPIDDIDLNTKQAPQMTEEIRKYLIQNNILVLLALKYSQLDNVKQLDYINEYEPLLGKKKETTIAKITYKENISHDVIKDMSIRYLIKLLPEEQKIHMPEISTMLKSGIDIYYKSNDFKEAGFAAEYIVSSIFNKTEYLFFNSNYKNNDIVPTNLRDLRQLLKLLLDMPEISGDLKETEKKELIKENQFKFQQYLFETWALINTDPNYREAIEDLRHINSGTELNASSIRLLRENFNDLLMSDYVEDEIKYIMNPQNNVYNYSLGDIIGVIDYVEKKTTIKKDLNFLFLLKALYTIKMHEYAENSTDQYDALIGGRFFNSILLSFIPTPKNSIDYSYRKINLSTFVDIITGDKQDGENIENNDADEEGRGVAQNNNLAEVVDNEDHVNAQEEAANIDAHEEGNAQEEDVNNDAHEEGNAQEEDANIDAHTDLSYIKEFFMLCISRGIDRKFREKENDSVDFNFRRKRMDWRADDFSEKQKNVIFDINAFLYNWINIDNCANRFKGIESSKRKVGFTASIEGITSSNILLKDYEVITKLCDHIQSQRYDKKRAKNYLKFTYFLKILSDFTINTKQGEVKLFSNLLEFQKKLEENIENNESAFTEIFNSAPIEVVKPISIEEVLPKGTSKVKKDDFIRRIDIYNEALSKHDVFNRFKTLHENDDEITKEDIKYLVTNYNKAIKEN